MREIQSSDIEARLPQLLADVEQGETVLIIRQGRTIARLVPETMQRTDAIKEAIAEIKRLRAKNSPVSVDEILAWRHEGHRH